MFTRTRVAVALLVASFALGALWVRGYSFEDSFSISAPQGSFDLSNRYGEVVVSLSYIPGLMPSRLEAHLFSTPCDSSPKVPAFGVMRTPNYSAVYVPSWFGTDLAFVAALAVMPWRRLRREHRGDSADPGNPPQR